MHVFQHIFIVHAKFYACCVAQFYSICETLHIYISFVHFLFSCAFSQDMQYVMHIFLCVFISRAILCMHYYDTQYFMHVSPHAL